MFSYIISYDLIADKDYNSLYKAIRDYGSFAHILESVWIINSSSSSTDIRDNLKSYIDNNDKLFVAKLDGESAWWNLSKEVSDWIHKNT
jgi:hypothetical protein